MTPKRCICLRCGFYPGMCAATFSMVLELPVAPVPCKGRKRHVKLGIFLVGHLPRQNRLLWHTKLKLSIFQAIATDPNPSNTVPT